MKNIKLLFVIPLLIVFNFSEVKAQSYVFIQPGTSSGGTEDAGPINNWFHRSTMHFVYTAAELTAAGLSAGATLDEISWYVISTTSRQLPGYSIALKHTTATNVAASIGTTGWTVVVNPHNYQAQILTTNAWNAIPFDNNFVWNGTGNLGVQVCWADAGAFTANGQVRHCNQANSLRYDLSDNAGNSCGIDPGTTSSQKPHARFKYASPIQFSDYAADPTTSTSFAHRRGANVTPKFTIESGSSFNAVQFELNTLSDFSGTATVSTISPGPVYAASTLHDIWTTTALPTDNRTYFARCRVSSDGGTTWGAWTTDLWPYSYFSPTVYEEEGWYYTTGEQFNTGVVQETLYDFTRITTTPFPDNGNVTLDQGDFSINTGTGDAVKENGTFYPNPNYMTIGWQNDCNGNNRIYNGFPFDVNIPQNSLILSADFSIVGTTGCVCETQSRPLYLIADAHDFGNAPALNTTNIQSAANRTTAKQIINYTTPTWSNNVRYTLAPVNTILQEIVSRGDWSVGNRFNLLLDWNSAYSPISDNNRCLYQANNGSTTAPRIEGDFTNFRNTVNYPPVDRAIYGPLGSAWDELKITDITTCTSCEVVYRIHNAVTNAVVAGPFTRVAGLSGSQSFDISGVGAQNIYVSASIYRTNTTPEVQDIWLTVTEPSPLPVELTSFATQCENNNVIVAWETASELNSSHFLVQRSSDLDSWTEIGEVQAKGISNTTTKYQVTDQSPLRNVSYYKLIQYDLNGDFEEFGPMSSRCNFSDFSLNLFPNPSDGNFTIRSESDERLSDVTLSITDAAGKIIRSEQTSFGKGTTLYNFQNLNLSKGSYFLILNHSQKTVQPIKFIVQ